MKYKIHSTKDGKDIITTEIVVHSFMAADAEDPDIYAASPMWEWQQTESGKWIMENAVEEPTWYRQIDSMSYGYQYQIRARLTPEQITFYELKYK
jgi:hypothetical protein